MQRRAEAEQIADPKPTLKLVPKPQEDKPQDKGVFKFDEDKRTALNFSALGKRLAAHGDLFRNPTRSGGLTLLDHGQPRAITKGNDLYPVIVDRVDVRVVKDGKRKGGRIPAAYLNAMPQTEAFLSQFRTVDIVTSVPMYLPPHFTLTQAGYNDGGYDHRIFHTGGEPQVSDSMETIAKFLDVMDFATPADRTNAVGAALTVVLRNHWLGGKPILLVTATKSHGGKGTFGTVPLALCHLLALAGQHSGHPRSLRVQKKPRRAGPFPTPIVLQPHPGPASLPKPAPFSVPVPGPK